MAYRWETVETVADSIFWAPKSLQMVTSAMKLKFFFQKTILGRKVMTNLDSIFREGNGNPLQYSCPENPWTEEPGRLQVHGVAERWT